MKLLKINEIKDQKELQIARDIRRTSTIKETLAEATRELDETKARFDLMLAGQRARWAQEEKEAGEQIDKLRNEIRILSKQKEALIPHDTQTNTNYTVDTLADLLQQRLDEVSERELALQEREQRIEIKEKALEIQYNLSKGLSQNITQDFKDKLNN